jgi:tetratricopeptide (TPR) repeat protein
VLSIQYKPTEAMACFEQALALKPDYAEAHYNQGIALKQLDRLDDAVACFERRWRSSRKTSKPSTIAEAPCEP